MEISAPWDAKNTTRAALARAFSNAEEQLL